MPAKHVHKKESSVRAFHRRIIHSQSLGSQFHLMSLLLRRLLRLRVTKLFILLLFLSILSPFIVFFFIRPTPVAKPEYGVTFSKPYAEQLGLDWKDTYTKILDDLQIRHIRVVAYWNDSEPKRDEYHFEDVQWQIEEAQKRNVDVMMAIGRKVPRWPECFQPEWFQNEKNPFVQRIEQDEYIEQAVLALKKYDNISIWQVENEPFFPFGYCPTFTRDDVAREVAIVRRLDEKHRPILVQDSGEGGYWHPTYSLGDYLGISMYRKIWFDFWGLIFGRAVYFQYPLAHWTYKIRAFVTRVPMDKIMVTELQAEPWGPGINSELTEIQKNKTMSRQDFINVLSYSQKTGFKRFYLWGVEWWLWEKQVNKNAFYWDTMKALLSK